MSSDDKQDFGEKIIEGKTKIVYEHEGHPDQVIVVSKDQLTAGDGARSNIIEGKSEIANNTNGYIFKLLNEAGVKTAFISQKSTRIFVAKKCKMIPIEWITRRVATGSYLKRHPKTIEGFRFYPPLQESCFKDDENHDPLYTEEEIIGTNLLNQHQIDIIKRTAQVVFEILEKLWRFLNCVLVDLKIEFGFDISGDILLADVIDNDSWRIWPDGKKENMKDKQVYRNLTQVTSESLQQIKLNYQWVAERLNSFHQNYCTSNLVVIAIGSPKDTPFSNKITEKLNFFGIDSVTRIVSAHKETAETLKVVAEYESSSKSIVFIAVAGKSNGLGPVISGNTCFPVINCPPLDNTGRDIWSSVNMPAGIGCTSITVPENAAIAAAQILALNDLVLWSKLRVHQLGLYLSLKNGDNQLQKS